MPTLTGNIYDIISKEETLLTNIAVTFTPSVSGHSVAQAAIVGNRYTVDLETTYPPVYNPALEWYYTVQPTSDQYTYEPFRLRVSSTTKTIAINEPVESYPNDKNTLKSVSGDNREHLNTFLSSDTPLKMKKIVGSFSISDSITVPAGVYLDASSAVITQTGANKKSVILGGDNTTLFGGELVGKGIDYVVGSQISADGIFTTGTQSCRVVNTVIRNFAGSGIFAQNTTDFVVDRCKVVGVGSPTITAGDGASCWGIFISGTIRSRIVNCDISQACQGIIGALTDTNTIIDNCQIHDIIGQHGIYLQNGTGLIVSNIDFKTINLNGIKVQLSVSSAADSEGMIIRGINGNGCLDNVVSVNNTATNLTSAKKFKAVSISDITGINGGRLLYLGSVRSGNVNNLSGHTLDLDGVTLLDCHDLNVSNVALLTIGRVGLRLTSATGSSMQRVTVSGLRMRNPANNDVASNQYGIYIAQGTDVVIDGAEVSSTNGFVDYDIFFAAPTDAEQQSFSLRNSNLSGGARFRNPTTTVREWSNNRMAGAWTFKPTGVVATTNVP